MSKKTVFFIIVLIVSATYCMADTFRFSADSFSSIMSRGREVTVLSGNARIVSGSTIIYASRIELFGNNYRFAECTGNVRVIDHQKGLHMTADRLVFDRIENIFRLEGSVVMEDFRNEVIVRGNFLEYSDQTEYVTIQVGVRILREDMICRSEFALFNRRTNILQLSGLPFVYRRGDEFRALRITINLDTDEITLEGQVSGLIHNEN
ncbi:MAG: hypothetical protein FWC36_08465 [Spirochaetes bacterium]|nr:hypothetical protein [Spirochaetota bacterium]